MDFKIGEVIQENAEELYLERIRPTTPDLSFNEVARKIIATKAGDVKKRQLQLLKHNQNDEMEQELKYFEKVQI